MIRSAPQARYGQSSCRLRDGSRVTLRPVSPDDKQLLAHDFDRLSETSRYRRFLSYGAKLSRLCA